MKVNIPILLSDGVCVIKKRPATLTTVYGR
jgi:hypothetical protein